MLKKTVLLLSVMVLAACGGDSGTSSNSASVGTFADAGLVSGLQYRTATQSGVTDSSGTFLYIPGETVTFSIGNIVLGQAAAAPTLNTFALVGMTPPLTSLGVINKTPQARLFRQVINISVLLQTLDTDANPTNGIAIPSQSIQLAADTTLNFNQEIQQFFSSFALRQYIERSRTAGLWGGSRAIVLSGYAANRLYAGLGLSPSLFATSKYESFSESGSSSRSSTYTYDANGNQIESKSFGSNNVLQYLYTQIYDTNGNQIEAKYFNDSNVLEGRDTFSYDANGNQIEIKSFDGNGNLQSRSTFTYDVNGSRIESKYFDIADELTGSYTNNYDTNGNNIESRSFNSAGELTYREAYTYDINDRRIESKSFNSEGELTYLFTYAYDTNGNQIESKSYPYGGNTLVSRSTDAYDANGNSIESKSFDSNNDLRYRYTQTYDVNGNRIESKYFDSNNDLRYRDTLTYDANGNLTEQRSYDNNDALNWRYVYTVSPISGWASILGSDDDDD